ncbi:CRTAC1 family protein [Chloroflexi bacterium TSY]|nr:CRTAC1 family protein [Chloroflexi bacterium TSY]
MPHITAENVERVVYFISNGAGLAINDLDNDGDLDLILGNLLGPNQIFWNEGAMNFRSDLLFQGSARAITTVDIDGDSWLDIVYTARVGDIRALRNRGVQVQSRQRNGDANQFVADRLLGVDAFAYAINWRDLDADGDLDLVSASYDAALEKQLGKTAMSESKLAGVYVYRREDGRFVATKLADAAQALTLELLDIDLDGEHDILVGNDFDIPDMVWLSRRVEQGELNRLLQWKAVEPFTTTTFSTMSFDVGDVNNDGQLDLFAADMHPYSTASEIIDQWQPVLDTIPQDHPADDPQRMVNMLQIRQPSGLLVDEAAARGIDASGWSWSAKFGDLDADGHLDLYVVNGMMAREIFNHLPNDELVEENQVFRNDGHGYFVPQEKWGLNSRFGGRSMSMADLDNDGDLDIVMNNLRAPSQIFENQLCQGAHLLVDLRRPTAQNTHAISGYLSGDPSRVHFGFPPESVLIGLEIHWPDGERSYIEQTDKNVRLWIERTD